MRTPARPRLQTLGEGEWSPKASRPGVGGGEYAEGDGEQMNAILSLLTWVNRPYNFDKLTAVKSRYPLTSIMWPYRGLKCGAHRGHVFF